MIGTSERRRFRARRTRPEEPPSYRLTNSIRLPWGLGLAAFLVLAVATGVLVGRTDSSALRVPQAILDYQAQIARDAAQSLRRSVNEGVVDLDEVARVLAVTDTTEGARLEAAVREFARAHARYLSVWATNAQGRILAKEGSAPLPDLIAAPPAGAAGMQDARKGPGGKPVIHQFAAVQTAGSGASRVVGQYDPGFMRFPLDGVRPGYAWVLNRKGEVVSDLSAPGRFESLARPGLRRAAARAVNGFSGAFSTGGSIDTQEVVGYAPVTGYGPAGRLGWVVVATRDVTSFELPHTQARRQGLMAGVALGVLTLLVFGWLYAVIVAPVIRIQREAERLAYGDLSRSVEVVRYDEIGLIGRALERLRILLIRRQIQKAPSDWN